ncbi:hypothetical protein OH76DRAFT_1399645 [Lentinus brumalis]|uniref:Transcription elongation factor Eaf N-terminal domain-containing protein n=1 Tax=Lentinus brumalis TaxID=2498619 RepID=A0A371DKJ3_9APHY|nr:hypothetical protein OH76DRAFT_1399645 [Polyporus brumalis]
MATTSADYPWMSGKHEVAIGNTVVRTLKARKGVPVDAKAKYSREFYSVRYNFKPESVDTTKAGTIEVRKSKDEAGSSGATIVRPSTQNDQGVNYTGRVTDAREFDCVLIYDEQTGSFTLEKLDTMGVFQHDPKTVRAPRYVGSPAPAAPPRASASASSSSNGNAQPPEIAERQEEEESEGEIPESKAKPPSRPVASVQSKAKQAASTRVSSPRASAPAPAPSPKPVPKPRPVARPGHGLPPKPVPTAAPAKSKSKPPATLVPPSLAEAKSATKRERPDEESLEIRRPAPPKKAKVAPVKKEAPPKQPVSLSFPDSSSSVALPSSLTTPAAPTAAPQPAPAPQPVATTTATMSDSEEEEWDVVPPTIAPVQPAIPTAVSAPVIEMEEIEMEEIEFTLPPSAPAPVPAPAPAPQADEPEGEEIDMDAFEELLNDQLGNGNPVEAEPDGEEYEDFLAGAVSPVAERQPLSLNQFAGGGADFGDDDEYSSSDDSDDD